MKPIASISRVNEILQKFELKAKKQYGQNFLIEPKVVENIASKAISEYDSLTIEIGPGLGSLTEQLAKRSEKILAFEIDPNMVEVLKYSLENYNNVDVIHEDFLSVDLDDFLDKYNPEGKKVFVAANLPYYITTPILFKLFESQDRIDIISVMMQKEVADRLVAKKNTKDYNALSIIVQYLYDVKVIVKVSKNVFIPKPAVESSVVQFSKKNVNYDVDNQDKLFEVVKACFKQRRKTLYNNLREYLEDKEKAENTITKLGYTLNTRAQELNIDDFINLYKELNR